MWTYGRKGTPLSPFPPPLLPPSSLFIQVLIPTAQHIRHLSAARLAADVCGTPTIIVARTDAESSRLLTK